MNTNTFSFKKKFYSIEDLVHKLYTKRIGVVEDQDLYDDIDKDQIAAVKNSDLLREIVIKERKTKAPLILLHSKNHSDDPIEKLNLEKRTPNALKEYWKSIEKEGLQKQKMTKVLV